MEVSLMYEGCQIMYGNLDLFHDKKDAHQALLEADGYDHLRSRLIGIGLLPVNYPVTDFMPVLFVEQQEVIVQNPETIAPFLFKPECLLSSDTIITNGDVKAIYILPYG